MLTEAFVFQEELKEGQVAELEAHLQTCRNCLRRYTRLVRAEREARKILQEIVPTHPPVEALYDYSNAPSGKALDEDERERIKMHILFCADCEAVWEKASRARLDSPAPHIASARERLLTRVVPLAAAGVVLALGLRGNAPTPRAPASSAEVRSLSRFVYPDPDALFSTPPLFPALAWMREAGDETCEVTIAAASTGPGTGPVLWRETTSANAVTFEEAARKVPPGTTLLATVSCGGSHPEHRLAAEIVLDPGWEAALEGARRAFERRAHPLEAAWSLAERYEEAERLPERALALALLARLEGSPESKAAALAAYHRLGTNGGEEAVSTLEDLAEIVFRR